VTSLAAVFVEHLPAGGHPVDDETLAQAVAAVHAAWPGVPLSDEAFVRYLAERLPEGRKLADVNPEELYLACACAAAVPQALAAFERLYLARVDVHLARIDASPAFAEEVRQVVRERLFVGTSPKIIEYSGRGALGAWLRVVAVRTALDLRRGAGPQTEEADEARALTSTPDPEMDYIKLRYKEDFSAAVRDALAALDGKARTLLRLHYVEGMRIERIAVAYDVHRATAHRWVMAAREALADGAKKRLEERLALGKDELASLAAVMQSQLEVSLGGLLDKE
jgi:RNA polymerase sigma-70 factor (ECF subfamily)